MSDNISKFLDDAHDASVSGIESVANAGANAVTSFFDSFASLIDGSSSKSSDDDSSKDSGNCHCHSKK